VQNSTDEMKEMPVWFNMNQWHNSDFVLCLRYKFLCLRAFSIVIRHLFQYHWSRCFLHIFYGNWKDDCRDYYFNNWATCWSHQSLILCSSVLKIKVPSEHSRMLKVFESLKGCWKTLLIETAYSRYW